MKFTERFGWSEYPFLRLCLPMLLGILFFVHFECYQGLSLVLLNGFCALALILVWIRKMHTTYRLRWIAGCVFYLCLFVLGGDVLRCHDDRLKPDYFIPQKKSTRYLIARLDEAPRATKQGRRCELRIEDVYNKREFVKASGAVMAYFADDSAAANLKYGDRVMFSDRLLGAVKAPTNPAGFDYKGYLALKQVYTTCTLSSTTWKRLSGNHGQPLVALSIQLRDTLLSIYRSNGIGEGQFGVLSALVLGYTQEIDSDLTAAYAAAGVTHVLSVSGMHVGLIYLMLMHALSFLGAGAWARTTRSIIMLVFLWFYALLTGLSPAVLRAATMLSLILIGKAWRRNENTINTVAASAFLLLLIDPWLLYDVGFQLSYLAVCGIVFIHPYIYDWYSPERNWLDQIWSLVSVSIAAQLTTCIPAIYYFHQFPLLFLLSNVLVIPLSTLIIYGGVGLLVCSPVPIIAKYIGFALNNMVFALNGIVGFVHAVPFALLENLWIGRIDVVLLHVLLVALVLYLISRKAAHLIFLLATLLVILFVFRTEALMQSRQYFALLYGVKRNTALDFVAGSQHVFISDAISPESSKNLLRQVKPAWGYYNLKEPILLSIQSFDGKKGFRMLPVLMHANRKWLFVSGDLRFFKSAAIHKASVDYLFLYKNTKVSIRTLLITYKPRLVLADGSSSSYYRKRWRDECMRLGMPFHDVMDDGAWVLRP